MVVPDAAAEMLVAVEAEVEEEVAVAAAAVEAIVEAAVVQSLATVLQHSHTEASYTDSA